MNGQNGSLDYVGHIGNLSGKLLKYCSDEAGGENVFISPLSVLGLLSMIAESTSGKTREEMLDFLGNPAVGKAVGRLQKEMCRDRMLSVANAVVVREDIGPKINRNYIDLMRSRYGAWVFYDSDIVRIVNRWAEINTNGMITDIAPDSLKEMLLCMANAVAFESPWSEPYNDWNVDSQYFHNADGTKSMVSMLNGTEHDYIENEDFIGFLKSYEEDNFVFMALLPKAEGSEALEDAIERVNYAELCKTKKHCTVHTMMPEFKFDYRQELSPLCKALGMKELFANEADFSPVAQVPLKMESILHKAFIEVNQMGTRAAAVTCAYAVMGGLPPVQFKEVNLDRPFVFAIVHEPTGIPVFTGIVRHLENGKADPERTKRMLERIRRLRNM